MEDGRWLMEVRHLPSSIFHLFLQSGRPDSNRRRPAWEAGILPTELRPRQTKRTARRSFKTRTWVDQRATNLGGSIIIHVLGSSTTSLGARSAESSNR